MQVRVHQVVPIVYCSFAFDSLLKIDLGFQIHIGILLMLAVNAYFLLTNPTKLKISLNKEQAFLIFILFSVLTGYFRQTAGALQISIYLLIALNVALFCQYSRPFLNKSHFRWFQWLMIITGLIQFGAFKLFGYQIAFIDPEHYEKGYSVTHRLRGFFIEPNWYAIAFAFNSLLLFGNELKQTFKQYWLLSLLTLVVMILNGTIATMAVLLLVYAWPVFKARPIRGLFLFAIMASVLVAVLSFRASLSQSEDNASALNHGSRIKPLIRVINYQYDNKPLNVIFGNGLGSWGTHAVGNRLSVLVYEPGKAVRDGSELPVFIFEVGVVGTLLFLFYLLSKFKSVNDSQFHIRGAVLLFFVSFLLYPTLKFWMYMPYFFYAVSRFDETELD